MKHPKPVPIGRFTLRAITEPPDDSGTYRWRLEWYVQRKLKTASLGRHLPEHAEDVAHARIAKGDLEAPAARPGEVATVGALLRAHSAYLKKRGELAPRSLKAYTFAIRHLLSGFDHVAIPVEPSALETYKNQRLLEGASTRLLDYEIKRLRAAWKWGRGSRLVPAEDLPKLTIKVKPVRVARPPTEGELRRVLAELAKPGARRNSAAWPWIGAVLLWATGCRVGELAAATWGGFDAAEGVITLTGKTGPREVPLEPPVVRALQAWRGRLEEGGVACRPDDTILGVSYETCRQQLAGRHIRKACKATGVPYFTAQGVRKMVVDALLDSGADPAAESAFAGHSARVAEAHYRTVRLKRLREIARLARLGHHEGGILNFRR